jgi:hypothetical protein
MFSIKYNRTTNHIAGLTVCTPMKDETEAEISAKGEVAYYAQNACGSLTRYRFADGPSFETVTEALECARKSTRKLCKTCEKAAEAMIAAVEAKPAEGPKEEEPTMSGKLKLSDVRGDISIASVGNGTPHALKLDGSHEAFCDVRHKDPLRSWGPAHEQKPEIELCAKCSKLVPTGPVEMKNETVAIPGLNREVTRTVAVPVDDTTIEGENPTVAPKTMTKEQQTETADEVRGDFERLTTLIHEANEEGLATLKEEIKVKVESITGTGAAAVKAKLRAEAEKTEADAREAAREAAKGNEVATLETQDYRAEVAGADEIVSAAAKRIGEALQASMKVSDLAKEIAATKMRIAARIKDKSGDPDVFLKTNQAKQASRDMYELAVRDLPETFESTQALKKLIKAVQNQQSDARTKYVRALDENPEEAALFVKALEANPDAKPSDAVFDFHKVDRKSRQEKELENWHKSRGELTAGEGEDESGEGEGGGEGGEGEGGEGGATDDAYADTLKRATAAMKAMTKFKTAPLSKLTDEQREAIEGQAKALEEAAKEIRKALI